MSEIKTIKRGDFQTICERHGVDSSEILWSPKFANLSEEHQPESGALAGDWSEVHQDCQDDLEANGYELVWSDDHRPCWECNCMLETEPSGMDWTPLYLIVEGDYLCKTCSLEDWNCLNEDITVPRGFDPDEFGLELASDGIHDEVVLVHDGKPWTAPTES